MATFRPFRGITYNFEKFKKDISKLLTPPYDVISQEEQEYYYRQSPYNVIRIILGKEKIGDTDWDNKYTRAAEYFRRWQEEKILIRADSPSIYVTSILYSIEGKVRQRWGFIGLVKIEDDYIIPHERTFSAHKEDRLRLMKACSAQLSQVFGLYSDPENVILKKIIEQIDIENPVLDFEFIDNTRHRMWIIKNRPEFFKQISDLMKDKKIIIADGHHRYETAKLFRDMMRLRYERKPSDRSYEFIMMYLSNIDDEGITILPSHRLIKKANFELRDFLKRMEFYFEIKEESDEKIKEKLLKYGKERTAIGFVCSNSDNIYLFIAKAKAIESMDDLHPSLKKLDVTVLSKVIFQKILGFSKEDLDNDKLFHYTTEISDAIRRVRRGEYQMAFLLNPTKIEQIKEIAENRLIMPRKSTYFYPKILTGLVFNKIDPNEVISIT